MSPEARPLALMFALIVLAPRPLPAADAPQPRDDSAPARPLAKLPGPAGTAVAFSRDGKLILTAGGDEARVWDAETFTPLTGPLKHKDGAKLFLAALSPDGKLVLTVAGSETWLWDATKGKRQSVLRHAGKVRSASFSPDASRVITASDDKTAATWDARTGARLLSLEHPASVGFAAFTPKGERLLTVTSALDEQALGELHLHDARTGAVLLRKAADINGPDEKRWVRPAAVSPDGTRLACIYTWIAQFRDANDGGSRGEVDAAPDELGWQMGWPEVFAFSPDGSRLAIVGNEAVGLWDVTKGLQTRYPTGTLPARGVVDVVFSPDGGCLLLSAGWGNAGVWVFGWGQILRIPGGVDLEEAPAVAWSPDGRRVAAGFASDGFTGVWEVPEREGP
jgi:WD40 repeat protein